MQKTTRWWWGSLLVVGSMLMAFAATNKAQDKKAYEKHDAAALYNSLRDVINSGAKLFNESGDHAGCYRLYQGSLLSVRPFLAQDLQKKIDDGIQKAERLQTFAERAFELRRVLDDVRTQVKPGAGTPVETKKEEKKTPTDKKTETKKEEKKTTTDKKTETKKEEKTTTDKKTETKKTPTDKKTETKKEEKKTTTDKKTETKKEEKKTTTDKKTEEKKTAATSTNGQVAGKITFEGKGIAGGFFVTLISAEGKKYSSAIQKDGSFQFKTAIPAGDYRIAVEPIPGETAPALNLPARYRGEGTSGLSVRVQTGKQQLDLNLVK